MSPASNPPASAAPMLPPPTITRSNGAALIPATYKAAVRAAAREPTSPMSERPGHSPWASAGPRCGKQTDADTWRRTGRWRPASHAVEAVLRRREAAGEADPQQAPEDLLDGGVQRADRPVELVGSHRRQREARRGGTRHPRCRSRSERRRGVHCGAAGARTARRRSPPAPASRRSRSAACADRA